jgi:hypothetical protein
MNSLVLINCYALIGRPLARCSFESIKQKRAVIMPGNPLAIAFIVLTLVVIGVAALIG